MSQINLKNILFIDIETVSQFEHFQDLSPKTQELWQRKARFFKSETEQTIDEVYFDRAGIYAEFGKIICIGIGAILSNDTFKVTCISGHDEREILFKLCNILAKHPAKKELLLCAHNGKEFDFPYISRRLLINGLEIPEILKLQGKKPWDVMHIDTLDLWKFGDYKHYTSLDLLANCFGLESSKEELSGDQVNKAYYKHNQLEEIATYCKKDVVLLALLYLRMNNMEVFANDQIVNS
jgi:3'-5' exonuclease